jgi:UDP-N-acetylmuramoylalanine-D-glutamate ligase
MSAPSPRKPHPDLPPGPFFVVVGDVDLGRPAGAAGLEALGVEVVLDADRIVPLDGIRTLVKSPCVPSAAPPVAAARERGREVIGELELAWRAIPNRELDPEATVICEASSFHLEDAVRRAAARSGDVVLLSPACASFDAFENFEARGDRFCEIARELAS